MLTSERKKELLSLCRDIGLPLTKLEGEIYVDQIALKQVQKLRQALEVVHATILVSPEE